MKKNFELEQIGERYDPEHDVNTSPGSVRVTWAEKALYDAVRALTLRISKLETQSIPEDISPNLKLFVWTEVLSHGVALALAHSVNEARMVIQRDKEDWMDVSEIFEKEPQIIEIPEGFALYGSN